MAGPSTRSFLKETDFLRLMRVGCPLAFLVARRSFSFCLTSSDMGGPFFLGLVGVVYGAVSGAGVGSVLMAGISGWCFLGWLAGLQDGSNLHTHAV